MTGQPLLVWYSRHMPTLAMKEDLAAYKLILFQPPRPHYLHKIWLGIQAVTTQHAPRPFPDTIMTVCPLEWRDDFVRLVHDDTGGKTAVIRTVMQEDHPLDWSGKWRHYFWNSSIGRVCWNDWEPLKPKNKNRV